MPIFEHRIVETMQARGIDRLQARNLIRQRNALRDYMARNRSYHHHFGKEI